MDIKARCWENVIMNYITYYYIYTETTTLEDLKLIKDTEKSPLSIWHHVHTGVVNALPHILIAIKEAEK